MKRVYIDMDGTLCDYFGAHMKALLYNPSQTYPQSQWGFYLHLSPLKDAIGSFKFLETKYDVWILSRPSYKNLNSYTEKAYWVREYLGEKAVEKLILCGDKSLVKGDFLIDDMGTNGQDRFEGEWLKFGSEKYPNWKSIINYLNY